MTDKKVLIAYYSHSGHTKTAAQLIKEAAGGDLFEILYSWRRRCIFYIF